jgi:hypothetical protein
MLLGAVGSAYAAMEEWEILVYAEGTEHRVGPRGVAVAPRSVPHAFMVTSETARILTLQTPGSGEAFYRDATEPANAETDPGRPPDWARLRAAAERHPDVIGILGPPPFEAAREFAARATPKESRDKADCRSPDLTRGRRIPA